MRARLAVSVIVGVLGCSDGMKASTEETSALWRKIQAQDAQLKEIQKKMRALLFQKLSAVPPQKMLQDATELTALLEPESFFSASLFGATLPLLDEAGGEAAPRYLTPLLDYLATAARVGVGARLWRDALVGKQETMQTGLQKLLMLITKLKGGEADKSLFEMSDELIPLANATERLYAFSIEQGNKGRIVEIREPRGGVGFASTYTLATLGEGPETLFEAPAEKVVRLKNGGAYSFLLDRRIWIAEEYLGSLTWLMNQLGDLFVERSKAARSLEEAVLAPARSSSVVFDEGDYHALRASQVGALQRAFLQTSASMEALTSKALSLPETPDASLPASLKEPLAKATLIEPMSLRGYGLTFLTTSTLSLLFQYHFLTQSFVQELQTYNQKVESTRSDLEALAKGPLPKPAYVVVVNERDLSGVWWGELCLLRGEPRTEERSEGGVLVTYRVYTLQASLGGTPFEHAEKSEGESVFYVANQEVFPEYGSQLLVEHQAHLDRIKRLAAELQKIQKQLGPALEADLSREISL